MYRLSVIFVIVLVNFVFGVPVHQLENEDFEEPSLPDSEINIIKENITDSDGKNSTKDLYVIRTIVYEIGILTDAGNDTDYDNETHEEIDLAFFDPDSNNTFVDLSNIPIPIQTNVSGITVTGILPANFGDLSRLEDGTPSIDGSHFPLFPNKQVKVSHNISTFNKQKSQSILNDLPEILGLQKILKTSSTDDSKEETDKEQKKDTESRLEEKLKDFDTEEIE